MIGKISLEPLMEKEPLRAPLLSPPSPPLSNYLLVDLECASVFETGAKLRLIILSRNSLRGLKISVCGKIGFSEKLWAL